MPLAPEVCLKAPVQKAEMFCKQIDAALIRSLALDASGRGIVEVKEEVK